MKIFISFCLILFCTFIPLKQGHTKQPYHILNEYDYSVLMYDMKNSLILNLLNQESTIPDQARQINLIRKQRPDDVLFAEFESSYIFSQLDLTKIKAQLINSLNQNNINLITGQFNHKLLDKVLLFYQNELEQFMKSFPQQQIDKNAIITAHVLFNPQIPPQIREVAKKFTLTSINIAISRLDKKQWHKQMILCMNNSNTQNPVTKLSSCAQPYNLAVIRELKNVLYDLEPYVHLFQKMQPMPPANQMQKRIYNNTYSWEKK